MSEDEAEMAARLDEYLDATVLGARPVADGLEPEIVSTVRRVHTRPVGAAPDPVFASRLWGTLAAPAAAPRIGWWERPWPVVARRPRLRLSPPWRWQPLANLATAAVVLVAVVAGYGVARLAAPSSSGQAPPAVDLFVAEGPGARFVPLDPETLADEADRPAIPLGAGAEAECAVASDAGAVLVTIEDRTDGPSRADRSATAVVRDGRSGAERERIEIPAPLGCPLLSPDGARLVVRSEPLSGPWPLGWLVFDTGNGQLLRTIEPEVRDAEGWLDAAARRLYLLVPSPDDWNAPAGAEPAEPPQLVAYDLGTGAEEGRLALPEVRAGRWNDSPERDGHPTTTAATPGVAVSPDGGRLVVAHANREAITMIDARRMVVERTVQLTRPTSLGDRLLGLLPLVPRSAEAAIATIWTRHAAFAPDGRRVYVWGSHAGLEGTIGRQRQYATGLGLSMVDIGTGRVVAEALPGELIDRVLVVPGGGDLYVEGPQGGRLLISWEGDLEDGEAPPPYLLQRLDAETLDTLAEREFTHAPTAMIREASTADAPSPRP